MVLALFYRRRPNLIPICFVNNRFSCCRCCDFKIGACIVFQWHTIHHFTPISASGIHITITIIEFGAVREMEFCRTDIYLLDLPDFVFHRNRHSFHFAVRSEFDGHQRTGAVVIQLRCTIYATQDTDIFPLQAVIGTINCKLRNINRSGLADIHLGVAGI